MFKFLMTVSLVTLSVSSFAKTINILGSIPFVRGADLCKYSNSYGQSRTQNLHQMVSMAERLLMAGMNSRDILPTLDGFNSLYDKNQELAQLNLDVSLASSFKSYVDDYYRDLTPKEKKLSFVELADLRNQRSVSNLNFVAYGTYTLAPSCKGNISITLHLIGKNRVSQSYKATGSVDTVMSQIASKIFTQFQQTKFPSTISMGPRKLTIVGGLNGSVDEVSDPELAKEACDILNARLPNRLEMEILDSYGDWSGGISLGTAVWAFPGGKVYAAQLRNPTPIREKWEVNERSFKYYCVK